MRRTLFFLSFVLGACTAQVSDLDDLEVNEDACDPRGDSERGTDLDLQLLGLTPHVNQDMFFSVTVNPVERNVEAIIVLSSLDDPDLRLVVPKLLPGGPAELAFWADSLPMGFDEINNSGAAVDHQWTRPICPNGKMTFTHDTPFQSVVDATSTGAVFQFVFPDDVATNEDLFGTFRMWVSAILLDENDPSEEVQTRVFYRWAPRVALPGSDDVPPQRLPTDGLFQMGGNALGERRGAIDQLSLYRIELVIDLDEDGVRSGGDFVCSFEREQAPDAITWTFRADFSGCDKPDGFDPATFSN